MGTFVHTAAWLSLYKVSRTPRKISGFPCSYPFPSIHEAHPRAIQEQEGLSYSSIARKIGRHTLHSVAKGKTCQSFVVLLEFILSPEFHSAETTAVGDMCELELLVSAYRDRAAC